MFAVLITALLCLVSVAHSDPASCENLVRPLDQVDPHRFEGKWAFVAGSVNNSRDEQELKAMDSSAIYFRSSSFTRVNGYGGKCSYHQFNFTMENNLMKVQMGNNATGTFYNASCEDCVLITMDIKSEEYDTLEFYLISKNRTVTDKVLEEFKSQAECFHLPAPVVLKQTEELCPEKEAAVQPVVLKQTEDLCPKHEAASKPEEA